MEDVLSIGAEVPVRVLRAEPLTFSMRNASAPLDFPSDQWFPGLVKSTTDHGAIVEVRPPTGGPTCTGWLHVSELGHGYVDTVEDVLTVDQKVLVRVLGTENGELRLSTRNTSLTAFEAVAPDQWHQGTVQQVEDFGAFVTVRPPCGGPACVGLVHVSEMSNDFKANPGDVVSVGQEVAVRVLGTDADRLLLSMKHAGLAAEVSELQGIPADQWFPGTVQRVEAFGAFVEVRPLADEIARVGFVHKSEFKHGKWPDARAELTLGQEVRVRVLPVEDGRFQLSLKTAEPASEALGRYEGRDEWLQGVVRALQPFGAFVDVRPPGVEGAYEGLVHVSQISDGFLDKVEDALAIGQEVSVRVIKVEGTRVDFSMRPATADIGGSRGALAA
mmetsp:Transcript_71816/g.222883  ORF Transcript_71816/g.222883 Transcript_71816/m.222883 type:complete len:387 (+) Transcript_71816:1-1161(+)